NGSGAVIAKTARRKPISPAAAFVLPPRNQCVSNHALTIRLRKLPGVRWLVATVAVNGRHFKTITQSHITQPIRLTGLPSGKFVRSIRAIGTDARAVGAKLTYRSCARKAPPPSRTLSVVLAGSGSGRVTGSGIDCPGTCSHGYPAGTMVTLTAAPASGSSFTG